MKNYAAFLQILSFMSDIADEVVDADMNYYKGCMRVVGETDNQTITIDLIVENKEEKKDA